MVLEWEPNWYLYDIASINMKYHRWSIKTPKWLWKESICRQRKYVYSRSHQKIYPKQGVDHFHNSINVIIRSFGICAYIISTMFIFNYHTKYMFVLFTHMCTSPRFYRNWKYVRISRLFILIESLKRFHINIRNKVNLIQNIHIDWT